MGARGRFVAPLAFAALVVVTLAVLVVSQSVRSRLVVDEIELSNEFRPSAGQEAQIRFRLTGDEESGSVEVVDDGDEVVAVLVEDAPLGDFEIHRFRWDGSGAPAGIYEVRVTLDSLGREVVLPEEIELLGERDG